MATNFITTFFFCVLVFGTYGIMCQLVPGTYIFGDSLVDDGNNNYLSLSLAKADFPHNGVDFPTGKATGRFSNGKNAADFLADKVGLPLAPPYLSLVSKSKKLSSTNAVVTGVNFASGGAGILNGTDELFGHVSPVLTLSTHPAVPVSSLEPGETPSPISPQHARPDKRTYIVIVSIFACVGPRNHLGPKQSIPLTKQVGYYSLVHDELVKQMGSTGAHAHLSKSIFLIVIGSNDLFGYFNKDSKVSKQYTPQQYVDLMASTLKGLMKQMYGMGARKFVISGVGVIGCCPAQRKHNASSECNDEVNYWSTKYNIGLKALLRELKTESSDMHYSYFETYDVMNSLIQNPQSYGITEIKEACCGLGNLKADIPCTPISTYCSNRKNHLFWDLYHPTETISSLFAGFIYNGSQEVTNPMNVEELIKV
ncbi:GDSL esterase/lipase At5g55050 isoform X1 [Rutidosis leptorrhynchoides]|uniref:GDSL esterase/lipase At5g55050 isoform X1 n=1 Tax=Rutidosis leptorrhynchoides TaxID=125765 RepID=UPI003A9917E0